VNAIFALAGVGESLRGRPGTGQGTPIPTPVLPFPTLPHPTLPYPTLPYPTLPYPTLPNPALPNPSLPYPFSSPHTGDYTGIFE